MHSRGIVVNGGSIMSRITLKQQVALFEEESVECLEKNLIALSLLGHIAEKIPMKTADLDQVRLVAKKQLQTSVIFLKIRKRDCKEQGGALKARINAKLSVYQAAAWVQVKYLAYLDPNIESSKKLLQETLALFIDAAESCLYSIWRTLRICEDLFSSLLSGISQVAVSGGDQLLRVLLIRLKPLVLSTCTLADTGNKSKGAMFESVTKTVCEIIEFGWSQDLAAVETFIMRLAACIREGNDYEEQGGEEKQDVPLKQLNVIRLLADINVTVNKSEVVDMILPLFIDILEEDDTSAPSLLRLQILNAVSRIACLGFKKSYRETVVLMTRSYLNKLSTIGSAETLAPEATTERVETLPAGFLLIAGGIKSPKLRLDYRHRLLSLCSDGGLAAESKTGRSGADFLGPLLPAVAEICSDFDPTADIEPSLLKLFRDLWFYIALF
ncbi:hypothetical protein MKW98_014545 [Papaver atlanticum]|uniref:PI4-kinase N-terminal domain-containing protein n=1 Tax=Papaver atlanticum TaxID=357466 RepID=A0AAD4T0U6_9MAGN|nr:hypothetical protein MKW98_014545 [Papaver atlanticum]